MKTKTKAKKKECTCWRSGYEGFPCPEHGGYIKESGRAALKKTTVKTRKSVTPKTMTPDQQRIAIAASCGWDIGLCRSAPGWWVRCNGIPKYTFYWYWDGTPSLESQRELLPDYLNDLNAMHTAIMAMNRSERDLFNSCLRSMLCACTPHSELDDEDMVVNATAAQRAEAYLRTKMLWTGPKL